MKVFRFVVLVCTFLVVFAFSFIYTLIIAIYKFNVFKLLEKIFRNLIIIEK